MWERGERGNRKCQTVTDEGKEKSLTRAEKKVPIIKKTQGGSLQNEMEEVAHEGWMNRE